MTDIKMAWSWSHSDEAYAHVEGEVRKLPHQTLLEVYAEWKVREYRGDDVFEQRIWLSAVRLASHLPDDILADFIWLKASEQRTCDQGGFNAHICPYQCHKARFG